MLRLQGEGLEGFWKSNMIGSLFEKNYLISFSWRVDTCAMAGWAVREWILTAEGKELKLGRVRWKIETQKEQKETS